MRFELPGNKYEKESWKSQPGFARGVRTGGKGWRSPLFERRLQRASGSKRTQNSERRGTGVGGGASLAVGCVQEEHQVKGGGRTRSC